MKLKTLNLMQFFSFILTLHFPCSSCQNFLDSLLAEHCMANGLNSHTSQDTFFEFLCNWRGVWNKALSDFWCNVKFSSSFTTEYKEIWKENLVIYLKSLKAFLQAPLQLLLKLRTVIIGRHPYIFGFYSQIFAKHFNSLRPNNIWFILA